MSRATPKTSFLAFLHLLTLWSFAIAQPLYDLLGRHPEFFVARRIDTVELFLLVLLLSFVFPALVGALLLVLNGLNQRIAALAQMLFFGILAGVLVLPVLRWKGGVPGAWILLPAALVGLGFVFLYTRFFAPRLLLSLLSPSILVFPVVFLAGSSVTSLPNTETTPPPDVSRFSPAGNPVPVVMLILDELPLFSLLDKEGNIDSERFPNFAALAGDSTWYRHATTVAESTDRVIPSILSGSYPVSDKLPNYLEYRDNLFTLLAQTHELRVFESITQICSPELCPPWFRKSLSVRLKTLLEDVAVVYGHLVLPEPWTLGIPDIRNGWQQFRKNWEVVFYDQVLATWELFLQGLERSSKPRFYYYHGLMPHFPWMLLPSGRSYSTSSRHEWLFHEGSWVDNEVLVAHGFQRYQLQLGFTDRQLGRLVRRLKEIGLYDRALILVLADHGFGVHPGISRRSVNRQNFADIMSVPLLVRFPGQTEGIVSETPAELIDLLPTIAEVLGLSPDWPMDGVSLLGEPTRRREARFLFKRGSRIPWVVDRHVRKRLRSALCLDGRVYHQTAEGLVGMVDSVEVTETEIEIRGRAGDGELLRPAAGVLVLLDGKLIQNVPVDEDRPEVAAYYSDPRMLRSGFRVRLERSLLQRNPTPALRLFAWDSVRASELVYPEDYPWPSNPALEIARSKAALSCIPGVAGLVLLEDVGEEYPTEEDSVKRLKQRAVEAGPDLILPPVAFQEFVGIKEDELEATPTAFRVELSSPLVIDPKRDREAYSVVEVSGRIGGAEHLPKDAHLLLASNGVVASILPLIEWPEGEHHFLGVLPKRPESLDQLSFYLVWREGKRTRVLKPLPSS